MKKAEFFLGSNSAGGFASLYDSFRDPKTEALGIIKGGPGSGKSTFMSIIAQEAEKRGCEVEYIRCSGDPDSLDGIKIPALRQCYVDGTAPHVMEPVYAGSMDTYLDLSRFYDRKGLAGVHCEIMEATAAYKARYARAYALMGSAGAALKALTPALPEEALESAKRRARGIALRELPAHGERSVTRRYLSAVTCKGPTAFYGTVEALADKVYLLDNECGLAPVLLEELAGSARTRAICCMEPIFGRQIEHLILPDLGLAFVSDSALVPYEGPCSRHLRLDAALPSSVRKEARGALKTASELIDRAVEELRAAKTHHDRLESLYNPYVDFDGVRQSAREEAFRLFK